MLWVILSSLVGVTERIEHSLKNWAYFLAVVGSDAIEPTSASVVLICEFLSLFFFFPEVVCELKRSRCVLIGEHFVADVDVDLLARGTTGFTG